MVLLAEILPKTSKGPVTELCPSYWVGGIVRLYFQAPESTQSNTQVDYSI